MRDILPPILHSFSTYLRFAFLHTRPHSSPPPRPPLRHGRCNSQCSRPKYHRSLDRPQHSGRRWRRHHLTNQNFITDLVPQGERGKLLGFQSPTWALGTVTGPLIGGAFAQEATWRWIFWINLPFCGLGFLTLPFCLQLNHSPGRLTKRIPALRLGRRQPPDRIHHLVPHADLLGRRHVRVVPTSHSGTPCTWNRRPLRPRRVRDLCRKDSIDPSTRFHQPYCSRQLLWHICPRDGSLVFALLPPVLLRRRQGLQSYHHSRRRLFRDFHSRARVNLRRRRCRYHGPLPLGHLVRVVTDGVGNGIAVLVRPEDERFRRLCF